MVAFDDLLAGVCGEYNARYSRWPAKTQLLKLAYVAEVIHKRRHGERLTSGPWIYNLYGPYRRDYDEVLASGRFRTEEHATEEDRTAVIVAMEEDAPRAVLPLDMRNSVVATVADYGALPLRDLLDLVYFDTEPMMNAEERLEELDFDTVQPQSHYTVRQLKVAPEVMRRLRTQFRQRVERFRRAQGAG